MRHSSFIDMAAVEAWDAWFRWRDHGLLRDVSIDDTLRRVSHALAGCEPPGRGPAWERQLFDALAGWRLLLDERVLASAGTTRPCWPRDYLGAALNPAVFVSAPFTAEACFRRDAFEATAELAVHALDNAGLLAGEGNPGIHLRIGVIGLADTLAQLGHPYDSAQGRWVSRDIAASMARGCLRSSLRLAKERGGLLSPSDAPSLSRRLCELRAELPKDAGQHGLRHACITAIDSHWRLAMLANNVADAVDPLLAHGDVQAISDTEITRTISSPGYAITLAKRLHAYQALRDLAAGLARLPAQAQAALRQTMQAWIDQPIDYPPPAPATEKTLKAIAAHLA
jgi:ribonucleoside-diphosphate reductase alpha chain